MTDQEINALLELDENALDHAIGKKLGFAVVGFSPGDTSKRIIAMSRAWMTEQRGKLKGVICASEKLRLITSHHTPVEVTRCIADIIAHHFIGFPPFEIAALLCREGITRFCSSPVPG